MKDTTPGICIHCNKQIPSSNHPGRHERNKRNAKKRFCTTTCASDYRHDQKLKPTRVCKICKTAYGIRQYASGQWESPSNFTRRTTCGKHSCVIEISRQTRAKEKSIQESIQKPAQQAMDHFLYNRRASV